MVCPRNGCPWPPIFFSVLGRVFSTLPMLNCIGFAALKIDKNYSEAFFKTSSGASLNTKLTGSYK